MEKEGKRINSRPAAQHTFCIKSFTIPRARDESWGRRSERGEEKSFVVVLALFDDKIARVWVARFFFG